MDTNKIRDTPKKKKPIIKVWLGYDLAIVEDMGKAHIKHNHQKRKVVLTQSR